MRRFYGWLYFFVYLLHAFGIFIVLVTLFLYILFPVEVPTSNGGTRMIKGLTDTEEFLLYAIPIGYIAIRLMSDYYGSIEYWRGLFDSSDKAKALLQQLQTLHPKQIFLLSAYPPQEIPKTPPVQQFNRMYRTGGVTPPPQPFKPEVRVVDCYDRVHRLDWSLPVNGMENYAWWLEHHLGSGNWTIGELKNSSGGGATGTYTIQENNQGGYSVYNNYSDPTVYKYGWYMLQKTK